MQFLLEAEEELILSAQFYNEREKHLGFDFLNELDAGIEEIRTNPKRWKFEDDNIQSYLMKRFPFTIFYEYFSKEQLIIIIAVAHHQ